MNDAKETAAEVRIDQIVSEYRELGQAIRQTEARRAALREQIEEWMGEDNDLPVEGLPTLRRVQEDWGWYFDLGAMREQDPAMFDRAWEKGGLTGNEKVLTALEEAGQITGWKKYAWRGQREVLRFDRSR